LLALTHNTLWAGEFWIISRPKCPLSIDERIIEKSCTEKNYNRYGKSPIQLIRITPFGIIQISQRTSRGNSDHSSKNDWHLFPHLITHLLFNIKWKKNNIIGKPKVSSMGPENISVNELAIAVQYLRHWHLYQQGKNEFRVIRITPAILAGDHLSNLSCF
jgi:hypothetical protein